MGKLAGTPGSSSQQDTVVAPDGVRVLVEGDFLVDFLVAILTLLHVMRINAIYVRVTKGVDQEHVT